MLLLKISLSMFYRFSDFAIFTNHFTGDYYIMLQSAQNSVPGRYETIQGVASPQIQTQSRLQGQEPIGNQGQSGVVYAARKYFRFACFVSLM